MVWSDQEMVDYAQDLADELGLPLRDFIEQQVRFEQTGELESLRLEDPESYLGALDNLTANTEYNLAGHKK